MNILIFVNAYLAVSLAARHTWGPTLLPMSVKIKTCYTYMYIYLRHRFDSVNLF